MTKKHFEAIARALRESKPLEWEEVEYHLQWAYDMEAVSGALAEQFNNFDREKFEAACKKVD